MRALALFLVLLVGACASYDFEAKFEDPDKSMTGEFNGCFKGCRWDISLSWLDSCYAFGGRPEVGEPLGMTVYCAELRRPDDPYNLDHQRVSRLQIADLQEDIWLNARWGEEPVHVRFQ